MTPTGIEPPLDRRDRRTRWKRGLSIDGDLELCQALAHAILSGYKDVQGALARFDFRFDAIVRCTFAYFEDHEADELRETLECVGVEPEAEEDEG